MPSAFDRHRRIGEIAGRMVIEYGEMEWDLCLFVGHAIQDPDTALKAMYRSRGETQRLNVADALARQKLSKGKLRTIYEQTLAHMRDCLKIRNQYAHTNWVDSPTHGLCYLNIEELADANEVVDTGDLKLYRLDQETIEDQQRFFVDVFQNLRYLSMETQFINGSQVHNGFHYVDPVVKPKLAQAVT